MIPLVLAAMFLGLVATASGQHRGQSWSPGQSGNIGNPGIGHMPVTPAGGGWSNLFRRRVLPARQTFIWPIVVYENGNLNGESGTYSPADGNPTQPTTNLDDRPPVVINQNLASPMDDPRFANRYPATGREFGPPVCPNPGNL